MPSPKGSGLNGRDSAAPKWPGVVSSHRFTNLHMHTSAHIQVFFFISVCLCECGAHGCSAQGGQKMASNPLELELQVVGGCLVWMLGKWNLGPLEK